MKLNKTTAFPASTRYVLPPLFGVFVLVATARAQQEAIQPPAPPVESMTQLAMTNSFQLFGPHPAASPPGQYEPFRWDQFVIRPHVDYQFTDAYHLLAAPSNQVDTTIQRLSPGLLFDLGPHWALDYTLSLATYSNTNFGTEVDHSITLSGQTTYGDWTFGLLQSVLLTRSALIEFGGQVDQEYFNTSVTGHHEDSRYISEDLDVNQNIQIFPGGDYEDMYSWSTLDWLNYQPQSHFNLGLGPGLGYNHAVYGPDSVYEQLQARVNWRLTDLLSLQISGGVIETEFLGSQGAGNIFSPIYSGSLDFKPFSQTELSLFATRFVSPSVLVDEYTEGTSFGCSIGQRFLGQFYFSAQASYNDDKYVAASQYILVQVSPKIYDLELINNSRTDKYYTLSFRLGHSFLTRGNVSVFYQYNSDASSAPGYSFAGNQFGGEVSYSF
ncbi:MAG TPA: hypothetical protein VGY98_17565 [Verrucomicrobiae bacterium]|nr:hypothetical protein [Verrucomicrobiae bacterium]